MSALPFPERERLGAFAFREDMPRNAPRGCGAPGCPELVQKKGGRLCLRHAEEERKRYDGSRGSAARRGYGRRWRKVRSLFLAEHPVCSDPFGIHAPVGEVAPATEVDHKVQVDQGGTDEEENLQALCKPCHSRKTATEHGRKG